MCQRFKRYFLTAESLFSIIYRQGVSLKHKKVVNLGNSEEKSERNIKTLSASDGHYHSFNE